MSNRKIATLWDNKDNDDSHDHDHAQPNDTQAFYAGGSEHSGQQILGPSRDGSNSDQFIQNLFNNFQQTAMNYPQDSAAAASPNTLPITFWRNGFTISDDPELRDYAENRQFLDCLRRGETPPELAHRIRGGPVDVRMEYKAHQDYKPEKKLQAFSGEGHRLGAPAPETTSQQETHLSGQTVPSNTSVKSLVVVESQPVTTIQVRLTDNTRIAVRANLTHTVGDLVSYLRAIRPQYSSANFVLATTFPARELDDLNQTVQDAKIANALISLKIKRQ